MGESIKMIKEELISVIIPVYNVEKYIVCCLESILNQSYKNLEIIIVDDGSNDGSGEICDKYKMLDSRVKVIHKEDGGLSDARNVGMEIATGNYITFIDSDDYVSVDYIENLKKAMTTYKTDISCCDYKKVQENCEMIYQDFGENIEVCSNIECLKQMYYSKIHGMEFVTWGKLYKKSLFDNYKIQFPFGKLHEDTYTTYMLVYYAKSIAFVHAKKYFYRIRTGSIMNSKFNIRHFDGIDATRIASNFFYDQKENELFKCAVNAHFRAFATMICMFKMNYREKDKKSIQKKIMKAYKKDVKSFLPMVDLGVKKMFFYKFFGNIPSVKIAKKVLKIDINK